MLNRPGSDQPLTNHAESTVSGRKPPDRDSVPTCPDPPFADAITAQFAAPRALAGMQAGPIADEARDLRLGSSAPINRRAKSTEEPRGWLVRWTSSAHLASSTRRTLRLRFSIRRRFARKVSGSLANPSEAQRRGHSSVTCARGRVRCQPTMGARERHDGRSRLLQALTKERWSDPQYICRLRSGQLENLAEHVRQPVRPVQALEHAERQPIFTSLVNSDRSASEGPSDDRPSSRSSANRSKVICICSTGLFFTSRT